MANVCVGAPSYQTPVRNLRSFSRFGCASGDQAPDNPGPDSLHFGSPVITQDIPKDSHDSQVKTVEQRGIDAQALVIGALDLDQGRAVGLVAQEIQQAFDSDLKHLPAYQAAG